MKKLEQLYEGKAKKVFKTDDPNLYIVDYKDDATAFNGLKKGTIEGKGIINNRVSNHLMKMLEKNGIPTHLVEEISDRETVALIRESPYLQYFLGFDAFTDTVPFSSRSMERFRTRIPEDKVRAAVRLLRRFEAED